MWSDRLYSICRQRCIPKFPFVFILFLDKHEHTHTHKQTQTHRGHTTLESAIFRYFSFFLHLHFILLSEKFLVFGKRTHSRIIQCDGSFYFERTHIVAVAVGRAEHQTRWLCVECVVLCRMSPILVANVYTSGIASHHSVAIAVTFSKQLQKKKRSETSVQNASEMVQTIQRTENRTKKLNVFTYFVLFYAFWDMFFFILVCMLLPKLSRIIICNNNQQLEESCQKSGNKMLCSSSYIDRKSRMQLAEELVRA